MVREEVANDCKKGLPSSHPDFWFFLYSRSFLFLFFAGACSLPHAHRTKKQKKKLERKKNIGKSIFVNAKTEKRTLVKTDYVPSIVLVFSGGPSEHLFVCLDIKTFWFRHKEECYTPEIFICCANVRGNLLELNEKRFQITRHNTSHVKWDAPTNFFYAGLNIWQETQKRARHCSLPLCPPDSNVFETRKTWCFQHL